MHGDLPAVQRYTSELLAFETTGRLSSATEQTTSTLNHAKARMVRAVLAQYETVRVGSPSDLRARLEAAEARVAELESSNRALRAALAGRAA